MEYRRFESIDQFRGFAIFSMVLVNVLGRFSIMPDALRHARYESLNFADAVAPFFFFVVGLGFRLSWVRNQARLGTWPSAATVFRRCAMLMVLAVFVYHFNPRRIFWDALSQISFGCLIALPVIGAGAVLRLAVPFLYAGLLLILAGGKARVLGVPFEIESASWPLMILAGSIAADWLTDAPKKLMLKALASGGALVAVGAGIYFLMPRTVISCALIYLGCSFLLLALFHYLAEMRHATLPQLTTLGRNALMVYALHYYIDDDVRGLIPDGAGLPAALLAFALVFGATYAAARYMEKKKIYLTV